MGRAFIEKPGIRVPRTSLLLLAMSLLAACSSAPEGSAEEQLTAWLDAVEAHAEAKERRALMSMLSPSFVDAKGNKIDDVEQRLRYWFFRANDVELLTTIDDIRVFDGSAAEMDVTVAMAGSDDSVLGFSADAYRYSLELVLQDGEWLLLSADWSEIGG